MKMKEEKEKIPFTVRYNRAVGIVQRAIEKLARGEGIHNPSDAIEKMRETSFVSQIIFSLAVSGNEAIKPHAEKLALLRFGKDVRPVLRLAEKLDVSWKSFSKRPFGGKKGQFLGELGFHIRKFKRSDVEAALSQIPPREALNWEDLTGSEIDWRDFLLRNLPPAEPEEKKIEIGEDDDLFFEDTSEKTEPSTSSDLAKKAGLELEDDLF